MADTNSTTLVKDEFGRDAAERLVELTSQDAEDINLEVTAGEHDTYEDALHYVITRGLAEIKRARASLEKSKQLRKQDENRKSWKKILEANPALITDANIVAKMMAELGVLQAKKAEAKPAEAQAPAATPASDTQAA